MPRANKGPELKERRPPGYANKVWFAVWYVRGKRRSESSGLASSGCADRDGATTWFDEDFKPRWHRANRAKGRRHPSEVKCAEALDIYASEHAPTKEDPERIGYAIKALVPYWGPLTIEDIMGRSCRDYARWSGLKIGADDSKEPKALQEEPRSQVIPPRGRKVSAGTVKRELKTLHAACRYCEQEALLKQGSVPLFWYPPTPKQHDHWLTREQAGALVRGARNARRARHHLPLFILIGLYMGARRDAILSLQWEPNFEGGYVDLDRGFIDFNPLGRVETEKKRARSPIPRRLLRFLRAARKRNSRYVVEYQGKRVVNLRSGWKAARTAAKLPVGITPHSLRHTCCTWLAMSSKNRYKAARYVDMDPETFDRIYAHHSPDYLKDVTEAFG